MPSKLLIAAAEANHAVERWPEFGLELQGSVGVDGKAVMARLKRERDRFVGFVLEGVNNIPDSHRIRGYARFLDDRTLAVDEHTTIRFSRAVIATGSSAHIPPAWRELGDRLIVNDDVFDWDSLPRSAAVFGAGVVGLEIGQALHRLGVSLTLFGRANHVGPFSDPAVLAYAIRTFEREFPLFPDGKLIEMKRVADGVSIRHATRHGDEQELVVDVVIAATGRRPNFAKLDLGKTSLKLDANGVPIYNRCTMQAGDSAIFIAGDASDDLPLHEAADEGRIAGENAGRYPRVESGLRRAPLGIVFSDPQLAVVGAAYVTLQPGSFVTGEVSFENQGRSRVMLRNQGLLHVYADVRNGRFLGAEMIGPDAEHIGHLLAWALQMDMTIAQMLEMPFYHPVVEEGLRTALRSAQVKLQQAEAPAIRRVA